jgi:glycosyltransferase involved in cell wall biosynthesis
MTISVALCTYNGEKFLKEQLESYSSQTQLPDELVICDDLSTDNSVEIIDAFQQSASFNVRLFINESRMGSTRNFERVISLCKGDIISLSDQDDWWYPEKLKIILDFFSNQGKYAGVFSDAEIVDEHMNNQNVKLWDSIGFTRKRRMNFAKGNALPELLQQDIVTGATLAFDANYKDILLPIPDMWVHDAWISLLLAYTSNLYMIEKPLIKYRQHRFQQIGLSGHSFSRKMEDALQNKEGVYFREAEKFKLLYERVLTFRTKINDPCSIELLTGKIGHLETRANMKNYGLSRITIPMKELISGRYHQYSFGWQSFFRDLVLGH